MRHQLWARRWRNTITRGRGMIQDIFERSQLYFALSRGFGKAFAFLEREDLLELPEGRYDIDGERVYAVVARGPARVRAGALLEVHERYIDVQCVLAGTDAMGWKPREACVSPSEPFDPARDVGFFSDEPETWLMTGPGRFVILFPQDAHMPMVGQGDIHKIIFKVAVDQG